MKLTDLLKDGVLDPVNREASRILHQIIETLDVAPKPDGSGYRFAFTGDAALLDQIGMWGSGVEDMEPDADAEDGDPVEDDGRDGEPMRQVVPAADVTRLVNLEPGVPQEMTGLMLGLIAPGTRLSRPN